MALNRKQMIETIRGGGSVLHNGRLIMSEDKLPSQAELASSEQEKAAAAGDIDAQIAALQAQKAALKTSEKTTASSEANSEGGGNDTIEKLMKNTRDQLLEKADEKRAQGFVVEFEESATKEVISQAILDAKKAE